MQYDGGGSPGVYNILAQTRCLVKTIYYNICTNLNAVDNSAIDDSCFNIDVVVKN